MLQIEVLSVGSPLSSPKQIYHQKNILIWQFCFTWIPGYLAWHHKTLDTVIFRAANTHTLWELSHFSNKRCFNLILVFCFTLGLHHWRPNRMRGHLLLRMLSEASVCGVLTLGRMRSDWFNTTSAMLLLWPALSLNIISNLSKQPSLCLKQISTLTQQNKTKSL